MIKTDVRVPPGYSADDVRAALASYIPVKADELKNINILRRRLDVSDKSDIHYRLCVGIELSPEREAGLLKMRKKVASVPEYSLDIPASRLELRPVVVGCGPCGLFAALILAEAGARPIILERGLSVEERGKKVELFKKLGLLDTECNVQFGEGGAGTYSDGKLKYGAMDKYKMKVLTELCCAGAPDDITYSDSAHLGTDKLPDIVRNVRNKITDLGGEFIFSARLVEIEKKDGCVSAAVYEKEGVKIILPTDHIILAIGHSARDSFKMLLDENIPMESRGFGIGVRIEHPREYINKLVYGEGYSDSLPTASYRLVTHLPSGRSVYSFCMCPGGSVVAAASAEGGIVTNGMSEYARDGENSNAAFLVSVTPSDFSSDSPLAGFELQECIERAAYSLTDSYSAPAIRMADFTENIKSCTFSGVRPTYPLGIFPAMPSDYLPKYITESLLASISDFNAWMPGFKYGDAVLTGPETRTTSPVRIIRDDGYESPALKGLFPAGEGAGYSGGIVSSAADGVRTALAVLGCE